jgi:hypothetical protein
MSDPSCPTCLRRLVKPNRLAVAVLQFQIAISVMIILWFSFGGFTTGPAPLAYRLVSNFVFVAMIGVGTLGTYDEISSFEERLVGYTRALALARRSL